MSSPLSQSTTPAAVIDDVNLAANPTPAPIPPVAHCPRCGYDQSGACPTWHDSCPLSGTCSECGLDFAWPDVLHPERIAPKWSFEHALFHKPSCLLRTLWISLKPRELWSSLRMAAPARPRRLALLAAIVILFVYFAAIVYEGVALWPQYRNTRILAPNAAFPIIQNKFDVTGLVIDVAWPFSSEIWTYAQFVSAGAAVAILAGLLMPLGYLALVQTLDQAKVRHIHLLRAWALFLPSIAIVIAAAMILHYVRTWQVPRLRLGLDLWLLLLFTLWLFHWWSACTRHYLKLPQPRRTVAIMIVLALMAALAFVLSFSSEFRSQVGLLII